MKNQAFNHFTSTLLALGCMQASALAHGSYGRPYSRSAYTSAQSGQAPRSLGVGLEQTAAKVPSPPLLASADLRLTAALDERLGLMQARSLPSVPEVITRDAIALGEPKLVLRGPTPVRELIIIDSGVADKSPFYKGLKPGFEVRELSSDGEGLVQLEAILGEYRNLSALHLVSHGADGVVYLGDSAITAETLKHRLNTLALLDQAIKVGGDVLLYGCNLAQSERGEALLALIAAEAHVDVAASTNATGAAAQGGDWQLELVRGQLETHVPFSEAALQQFTGILAPVTYLPDSFACASGCGLGKLSYTTNDGDFTFSASASGTPEKVYAYDTFRADDGMYFAFQTFVDSDTSGAFRLQPDNVDVYSFELTGLVFSTYGGGSCTGGSVVGDLVGGGTIVDSITWAGAGNSATLTNHSGVQITGFSVTGTGCSPSVYHGMGLRSFSVANQTPAVPALDTDGSVTAAASVIEPVALAFTADTPAEAVELFDFTLSDGGGADGLAMTVSSMVVHVSGTSSDAERGAIAWRLNGSGASNVVGSYDGGADTLTFNGLNLVIADATSEVYTVSGYYTDTSGLNHGDTVLLSVDGDTDLSLSGTGTQMGPTAAVTNASGTVIQDNVASVVTSVGVPVDAQVSTGVDLNFTVNFDETVFLDSSGGTPRLVLTIGATTRYATYLSGHGSSALVFRYTVQSGDNDGDGISLAAVLDVNGGTITDSAGNNANTTLNAIGNLTGVWVDAQAPNVAEVTAVVSPSNLSRPQVTIFSDEAGSLAVGGSCGSGDEGTVSAGNTVITLAGGDNSSALTDGDYSDCSVTVTDAASNVSTPLTLSSFTVDTQVPSGHSVAFSDGLLDASEVASTSFVLSNGELNADYSYVISSTGGGSDILGNSTVVSNSDTLDGINVSGLGDGTLTLSVTLTDAAGNAASAVTATAEKDTRTAQTISFSNPGPQNFGASPTLLASASSGLVVDFATTTPTVCGITSVGILTSAAPGQCTISVSQAGDDSYLPASAANQSFEIVATVPDAPAIGTAIAGNGEAIITFTAANFDGGAAVTSYTATANPGGQTVTGASGPLTLTGLSNDMAYTFTVTASNSVGESAASQTSNVVEPSAAAVAPPVVLYDFENNSLDGSGNNNDGTLAGGYSYIADGHSGSGLHLDGSGYLTMPDGLILANQDFTVAFWFRGTDRGGLLGYQNDDVANIATAANYVPLLSVNDSGLLRAELWTSSGGLVLHSSGPVDDGSWHNVAMTADTGNGLLRVYLDGELMGESSADVLHLDMSFNQLGLNKGSGRDGLLASDYFTGDIDEFTFYEAALPASTLLDNQAPIAADDDLTVVNQQANVLDLLSNDGDSDGTLAGTEIVIVSAPSQGAVVNNNDGTVSYTPNVDADVYAGDSFSYTVADNQGAVSNVASVSLTFTPAAAPSLAGTPAVDVEEGGAYVFAPTVMVGDAAFTLSYSASNMPAWATFNEATGELSGSPGSSDVGTAAGIVIRVTDGTNSAVLPSFSIEVVARVDSDGDTLSDYQERLDQTDPNDPEDYLDLTAPVLTAPADIIVDASGLFTRVNQAQLLGLAPTSSIAEVIATTATLVSDNVDGANCCNAMALAADGGEYHLPPGAHSITWQAEDRMGNSASVTQMLYIRPLVSLTKDQVTAEGAQKVVGVVLNGPAPFYPLHIPYRVNSDSTATQVDHDLQDGVVTLTDGQTRADILVNIYADDMAESDEVLLIQLDDRTTEAEDLLEGFDADIHDINAGTRSQHQLTIVERNVAPQVRLQLRQGGRNTLLVAADGGPVTVTATIIDPNPGDSHALAWNGGSVFGDTDVSETFFSFDPTGLAVGPKHISATVTDSAGAVGEGSLRFRQLAALPTLSTTLDSDGDGRDDDSEGAGDDDGDGIPDYLDNITLANVLPEVAKITNAFLLECDPGVLCRLGQFSLRGSAGGAQLTQEDIAAMEDLTDDRHFTLNDVFDFEMAELPEAGQSARVVIPQAQAIPTDAVYRKFVDGQWQTFVTDANNQLHSAAGEAGFCPPPGDAAWQVGLSAGHYCVQLTLEDGGPNDGDGEANHVIADPGAVAVQNRLAVHSRSRGGALGLGLMLLLGGMVVCRRKTPWSVAALLLLGLGVMPEPARAERPELFVEVVGMDLSASQSRNKFESTLAFGGVTADVSRYRADRSAYQLNLGVQQWPQLAYLIGYTDLDQAEVNFAADSVDSSVLEAALISGYPRSGSGLTAALRYSKDLPYNATAFADVGVFSWRGHIEVDNTNTKLKIHGREAWYALGVKFALTPHFDLGLRYQVFNLDNQDVKGLGLVFSGSF